MAWRRRIRATSDGGVDLRLADEERALIGQVVGELRVALEHRDAPELRRLAPPAHPHDPEAEAQYRSLVGEGLWKSRDDVLDLLEASLSERHLDAAQLEAWMRAVNDVRLVLGTMLDVGPELPRQVGADDPRAVEWAVYDYLSGLLEELVQAVQR